MEVCREEMKLAAELYGPQRVEVVAQGFEKLDGFRVPERFLELSTKSDAVCTSPRRLTIC